LAVAWSTEKPLERKSSRDRAARADESWGQVLGTRAQFGSERYAGLGSGLLRRRHERVDELEHVVRERAGGVGRDPAAHPTWSGNAPWGKYPSNQMLVTSHSLTPSATRYACW
jgi:hypothetical protein